MPNRSPVMQEYKPLHAVSPASVKPARSKPRQSLIAWSVRHFRGYSELEAHNLASGTRQIVAKIAGSKDIDAESVANFVVSAVNDYDGTRKMIRHMADALEKCIACKDITWEAEHDGDILIRRAREYLKD